MSTRTVPLEEGHLEQVWIQDPELREHIGTIFVLRDAVFKRGRFHDNHVLGILADEFRALAG